MPNGKKKRGKKGTKPANGPPAPRFPLPQESQRLAKAVYQQAQNIGLLFNKFVWIWDDNWTLENKFKEGKRERSVKSWFLEQVESIARKCPHQAYGAFFTRQAKLAESLQEQGYKIKVFNKQAEARILSGLGGAHPMEVGFAFHPLYGFPYLPGSGLKGVARAWAELGGADPADIKLVFGSESKDERRAREHQQGDVIFFDAYATALPQLEVDILNPHFPDYYRNPEELPTEWQSPNPVNFLTVGIGKSEKERPVFRFILVARSDEALDLAQKWLECGLEELGFGGKTASGYGYFAPSKELVADTSPGAQPKPASTAQLPYEIQAVQLMPLNQVASQIRQYYEAWRKLSDEEARRMLAEAILEKLRQAKKLKSWKDKDWVKELQEFVAQFDTTE
ncbi:type III-B CRISPR module RAMP protein Cmr6 [Candidatus Parcubacteria bacterium]|nr:MAG: type III-B CRISPR module RAMP protein Cmr6 [Candidatus Parcubacteria bacterium]